MRESSGDRSDARPWTVTVVVGLIVIVAAAGFLLASEPIRSASPGRAATPYTWIADRLPIVTYAVLATGVWFGRQWARIAMLLLASLNTRHLVIALIGGGRPIEETELASIAFATIVVLLLLPTTHLWFRDRPRPGQLIDTPALIVLPNAFPRATFLLVTGGTFSFFALGAISEGGRAVIALIAMAFLACAAILMLVRSCREVRLEFGPGRIVIRYRNALLHQLSVVFPLDRFSAVRTALTKGRYGSVSYTLELVTMDGKHAVQLACGDAKPPKYGMAAVEFEPDNVAALRATVARRLGVVDGGCVGFKPPLPTLRRREGSSP